MKIQRFIPHTTIIAGLCSLCFPGSASAQTPAVNGKYIGNGKNAELKFISAQEDKPFDDKPAIQLIFTEKDPANSKDPDRDAMFGKLGSTLSLSVLHNGDIFSCQVGHTALKKSGFSTNSFKMSDFKFADGKITGRVSTGKECEFFGETYEADFTFTATLAKSESKSESKSPAKPASGPLNAAQKAFVDSYKKALETKDTKALAAFLHTEGASADSIEFFTMMQSAATEGQIESIDLIKPSDEEMKKFNQPKEMPDGQLVRMPFAPTHQLSIVIKDSSGTSTSKLPVGEHKGKLVIPVPVPLNASSKAASTAPTKPRNTKPAEAPIAETAPVIAARALPLPKDASDVEHKQAVKTIRFNSARSVTIVAKEFAANLKKQGWKDGKGNLMTPKSTILKRELGKATLTIMIKPAAQGSETQNFTEGLDWSDAGDVSPSASKQPASVPSADEFEWKANKAIQDALKNLPKGLQF